jgi:hypothetical protein
VALAHPDNPQPCGAGVLDAAWASEFKRAERVALREKEKERGAAVLVSSLS